MVNSWWVGDDTNTDDRRQNISIGIIDIAPSYFKTTIHPSTIITIIHRSIQSSNQPINQETNHTSSIHPSTHPSIPSIYPSIDLILPIAIMSSIHPSIYPIHSCIYPILPITIMSSMQDHRVAIDNTSASVSSTRDVTWSYHLGPCTIDIYL